MENIGKLRIAFKGRKGEEATKVVLENVKFVPEMKINLFSFMVAIKKGASLHSEGTSLVLMKDNHKIVFNTKVPMGSSFLVAANAESQDDGLMVATERKEMRLETYHRMLGHPSIDSTKLTARDMGLKLTGNLKTCENCMLAKIRRKNIKKVGENNSKVPSECLMIDISFIKQESLGKRNIWVLIEDQYSKMRWSVFTRRRCDMVKEMVDFIRKLKAKDQRNVSFLRMDNAKENVFLKQSLDREGLKVEVEFTSPNTPEQKGQVERSFATLWGRIRAMLNDSGVEKQLRNAECASTTTKLSNLIARSKLGCPYELFYGKRPKIGKDLRIFGEIGIKISRAQVHHEKLNNKGNECIFVGYEDNHPQDAYRVFDLKINPSWLQEM